MIQLPRQPRVPPLGETRRNVDAFAFGWIEIDIEVIGVHHVKIERTVSDFVASEVLGRGGRPERENQTSKNQLSCARCHARWVNRELHVTRRISTADRTSENAAASVPRDLKRSLRRYDTPLIPSRTTSDVRVAATALISTVEVAETRVSGFRTQNLSEPLRTFRTSQNLQNLSEPSEPSEPLFVCVCQRDRKQTILLVGSSRFFEKNFVGRLDS